MRFEKLETFQPIIITLESEEDFYDIDYALKAAIGRIENSDSSLYKRLQKMSEELDRLLTLYYNA